MRAVGFAAEYETLADQILNEAVAAEMADRKESLTRAVPLRLDEV
jgi:hypothetical protein